MEWINKIWTTLQQMFSEGPEYIKENPKSGYLVVILILLVPNGFRFWLGVIVVLAILLSAYLFFKA